MSTLDLEKEFPLDASIIHLNHAGVGPWPLRTVETVCAFANENMRLGSYNYMAWLDIEQSLRELGARLINASSADTVALLKNTSEALSLVAYGIDWQPGDQVIIPKGEFPSNRVVWESLKDRYNIELLTIDIAGNDPEQAIIQACSSRTRLISVSSVNYATGLRLNLEILGRHCRDHHILFCIDAIQSLGALPFDVQACHADFVAADGHKWMLGPEGVALFYCRPESMAQLRLNQFGWHMMEEMGDFDRLDWTPALSARRFECGSPNNMGIHGLRASLELIHEIGIEAIFQDIINKCLQLESSLIELGCDILSATADDRRSGILCFSYPGISSEKLYQHLMAAGILCAFRGGGVRFSPHFYTPEIALRTAIDQVKTAIDQLT